MLIQSQISISIYTNITTLYLHLCKYKYKYKYMSRQPVVIMKFANTCINTFVAFIQLSQTYICIYTNTCQASWLS